MTPRALAPRRGFFVASGLAPLTCRLDAWMRFASTPFDFLKPARRPRRRRTTQTLRFLLQQRSSPAFQTYGVFDILARVWIASSGRLVFS